MLDDYGDVGVVRVEAVDRPAPRPGEIHVQVVAAGVAHTDAYLREGRFRDAIELSLPAQQGFSFADIETGRVQGKRLTSFWSLQTDVRNAGGDWQDTSVVVDDSDGWTLITSRNPKDLDDFVAAIDDVLA